MKKKSLAILCATAMLSMMVSSSLIASAEETAVNGWGKSTTDGTINAVTGGVKAEGKNVGVAKQVTLDGFSMEVDMQQQADAGDADYVIIGFFTDEKSFTDGNHAGFYLGFQKWSAFSSVLDGNKRCYHIKGRAANASDFAYPTGTADQFFVSDWGNDNKLIISVNKTNEGKYELKVNGSSSAPNLISDRPDTSLIFDPAELGIDVFENGVCYVSVEGRRLVGDAPTGDFIFNVKDTTPSPTPSSTTSSESTASTTASSSASKIAAAIVWTNYWTANAAAAGNSNHITALSDGVKFEGSGVLSSGFSGVGGTFNQKLNVKNLSFSIKLDQLPGTEGGIIVSLLSEKGGFDSNASGLYLRFINQLNGIPLDSAYIGYEICSKTGGSVTNVYNSFMKAPKDGKIKVQLKDIGGGKAQVVVNGTSTLANYSGEDVNSETTWKSLGFENYESVQAYLTVQSFIPDALKSTLSSTDKFIYSVTSLSASNLSVDLDSGSPQTGSTSNLSMLILIGIAATALATISIKKKTKVN